MDASRFLRGLDEAQRRAVVESSSPLAILAPAGSGKTRVLTSRIGYQAAIGVIDPRRTLALTFTRRAAEELRTRLRVMGVRDATTAGTFHAIAYAQLRTQWADRQIRPPGLLEDRSRFLRRHLGSEGRGAELAAVTTEIDWAKARLVRPERYAEDASRAGREPGLPHERVASLYRAYEDAKGQRRVVDFDDLLRLVVAEMDRDESYASAVRWRHQHLFVDEFQDVNPLQFRLLESWLGPNSDLCVVGDPNQAIYAWNGADAGFLTDFTSLFPKARTVHLDTNYRSTRQILTVATAVLDDTDVPRPPPTNRDGGPVPDLVTYETGLDESRGIARALRDRNIAGRSWSQQAVLCRTRRQLLELADELRAAGVPHRVRRAGLSSDPAIKAILTELRHTTSFEQFLADLREPEDIGDNDADDMDVAEGEGDVGPVEPGRPSPTDGAGGESSLSLPEARRLLAGLAEDFADLDPAATVQRFQDWLKTAEDPGGWGDQVTVATFHAAKGLEWPVVHIAGLETGFCPIHHAQTPEAQGEERRLVYVACTRATDELVCSWARQRRFGTRTSDRTASPYLTRVERARVLLRRHDRPAPPPPELATVRSSRLDRAETVGSDELAADERRRHLDSWRTRLARGVRVEPRSVLDDGLLDLIAQTNPTTLDELRRLDGFGPVRLEQIGPDVLDRLAELNSSN